MSIFTAILLGLIRGITEFMPVSSSGHMAILQNVFGLKYVESENLLFEALLDIAFLLSVFFAYKKEIKVIVKETGAALLGRSEEAEGGRFSANVRTAFFIAMGTLPMVITLPFYSRVQTLSENLPFVAFALIVSGALVFASGKMPEGRKNERTSTLIDALLVGTAQMIAVIPGLSIPGATISVGLARGFRKSFAVKFAFLLTIPTLFFSAASSLVGALSNGVNWSALPGYIIGTVIAVFVGYYAIIILRNLLKSNSYGKISRYCWAVGLVALIASLFI